jgi:RNA polymerase sigma-70 factor (ECF subfamily)
MVDPQLYSTVDDVEVRFHQGDERALADIYDQHSSLIYSYCRRQLGAEAARDITQEVFVAAWRARHRFDPEKGSIRAWLMGITKNKIIDLFRKRGRRPLIADGAEVEHSSDETDSVHVEQIADRMILAAALEELPDRARSVIELSFYQQLTHPEIAERTGLPLGTVKSDIRRSLIKLRRQLEDGND